MTTSDLQSKQHFNYPHNSILILSAVNSELLNYRADDQNYQDCKESMIFHAWKTSYTECKR